MNTSHENSIRRDIASLGHTLRSHIWKILAMTALCTAAGVAYVVITPKMYKAEAILQVEQNERRVTTIQDVAQEDFRAVEILKTIEARLTTDEILLRLIHANGLDSDPVFTLGAPTSEDQLIKRVRKAVKVKLQRSTRLINVSFENPVPDRARQLTVSLVDELMKQDSELSEGISKNANHFLVKQADDLKEKLKTAEQALEDYREKHHAVSLEEKQNIVVDALKDLNHQLSDMTNQRIKLETDYAQFNKFVGANPEELLSIPTIANSADVQKLRKSVSDQEAVIAAVSKRYRSEHPQYIEAHSQLQQMRSDLNVAIRKAGEGMKSALESAQETETSTRQALEKQQNESLELSQLAIPYVQLEREVESDRALYSSVLNRLKETDVTSSLKNDYLRIVQAPRVGDLPSKPKIPLILLASFFGGLFAGIGTAITLEAMDSSLKTLRDVESGLGVVASATIPKGPAMRTPADRLVVWKKPDSPVAEAFRSLRATLTLRGHGSDAPAIVFTSAIPGEGKSFCSLNYATALGQQGLRTLLVDAELRKSTITSAVLGNESALGLGEYLDGKCSLAAAIHKTEMPNVSIIPCGVLVSNPAELMATARATGIVDAAIAGGFDRIVIDAGPMNSVSDALPLIERVGKVCFIVKAAGAARNSVQRAYQLLTQVVGAEHVAVVVNSLPLRSGMGCYYHYMTAKYGDRPVYGRAAATQPFKA